ncbi:hypothetical protein V8F06_002814 [Rhypophila decipiens]
MASSNNHTNTEPKLGWRCPSCGVANRNDRFYCQTCYISQDGKTKLPEELRQREVTPIETLRNWRCQSCEAVNPNDRFYCQTCYVSEDGKTKLSENARQQAVNWRCQSCEAVNRNIHYFCQTCYVSQDGKTNLSEDARQRAVDTVEALTKQPAAPTAAQPSEPIGPIHTSTLPTGPINQGRSLLAERFSPPPLQATGQPVELVTRPLPPPSGPVWESTIPTDPMALSRSLLAQPLAPPPLFSELPEATRMRVEYTIKAAQTWNQSALPAAGTAAQPNEPTGPVHTSTLPTVPIDPALLAQSFDPPPLRATGPLPLPVTQPVMGNPNNPATQSTAHSSTTDEAGFAGSAEGEQTTKGCDKKDG